MAFSGIKLDGKHLMVREYDALSAKDRTRAMGQMRSGIDDTIGRPERAIIFAAPGLTDKFASAVVNFFSSKQPAMMQTAIFKESASVPYVETRYNQIHLSMPVHPRGPVHVKWDSVSDLFSDYYFKKYVEEFNVPEKANKNLATTRYSWHEARREKDEKGSYYEIHEIKKISPGLNADEEIDSRKLGGDDGLPGRMDKATALKMLQALEHVAAAQSWKTALRDEKPLHHFSHYLSEEQKAAPRPPARKEASVAPS